MADPNPADMWDEARRLAETNDVARWLLEHAEHLQWLADGAERNGRALVEGAQDVVSAHAGRETPRGMLLAQLVETTGLLRQATARIRAMDQDAKRDFTVMNGVADALGVHGEAAAVLEQAQKLTQAAQLALRALTSPDSGLLRDLAVKDLRAVLGGEVERG